jgi:hypothetical protein
LRTENVRAGDEIVFCTDGYPTALGSLAEAERALRRELRDDPLRIHRFAGTKAFGLSGVSFDDRAYIRFTASE